MTWLLKLYPARWRRRYGEEFRTLIGAQRFSIANVVDVIAGAIDAWIDPQTMALAQTAPAEEGETMTGKTLKFRCAGYGPGMTKADQWKSTAVMLGGTLILTVAWMWLHFRTGDNPYVDSFAVMPFLAPLAASMRYTHLKGRPVLTQVIFIGSEILILALLFALVGWITARI